MINLIDQYYKIYFENQQDTQLEKFRKDNQLQPYRIRQLFFEIFKNSRIDFADMTTLSKDLRKKLSDNFEILSLKPEKIVDSSDTTKIAFRTKDGYIVESVIMYHKQGDSGRGRSEDVGRWIRGDFGRWIRGDSGRGISEDVRGLEKINRLTYEIIGCAMMVHREYGPGFQEKLYKKALIHCLKKKGFNIEEEKKIDIYLNGELIGYGKVDVLVEGLVPVEIKSLKYIGGQAYKQLRKYIEVGDYDVGLILNFGNERLDFRRLEKKYHQKSPNLSSEIIGHNHQKSPNSSSEIIGHNHQKSPNLSSEIIGHNHQKSPNLSSEIIGHNHQKSPISRITLCVSSQVGCPVGCLFCVTGKLGFTRNLTYDEIISQLLFANYYIRKKLGKKEDGSWWAVRNVVFMGMGEPLLNYDNVKKSIQIMLDQKAFSLSRRRVTISTSGIIPGIQKLIEDKLPVMLAVSLHAPNQPLREKLIPIARSYTLDKLMKVLDKYIAETDNRIFYEYIMIKDLTDKPELAYQLADLIKHQKAHVNLIPYNENPAIDLEESSWDRILNFKKILEDKGITVTIRDSLGRDVKGACGQLGYEILNK